MLTFVAYGHFEMIGPIENVSHSNLDSYCAYNFAVHILAFFSFSFSLFVRSVSLFSIGVVVAISFFERK